ncbi:MAG: DUF4006 family protein [Candidatus Marithrix sp.]
MKENHRNIFALDGIAGMLIATILLLTILGILTVSAIFAQRGSAKEFYIIKDAHLIKAISTENNKHIVLVK